MRSSYTHTALSADNEARGRGPRRGSSKGALTLELHRGEQAPGEARTALRTWCYGLGLPEAFAARLLLVMSELVANAVEHSRASEGEPVSVLVARQRDGVRLEVTDGGSGFEPTGRRPAGNQRGYGLFLVDQLTNRWGVERGPGARVWCELDVLAGDLAR